MSRITFCQLNQRNVVGSTVKHYSNISDIAKSFVFVLFVFLGLFIEGEGVGE